jgi:hypothetical protein
MVARLETTGLALLLFFFGVVEVIWQACLHAFDWRKQVTFRSNTRKRPSVPISPAWPPSTEISPTSTSTSVMPTLAGAIHFRAYVAQPSRAHCVTYLAAFALG